MIHPFITLLLLSYIHLLLSTFIPPYVDQRKGLQNHSFCTFALSTKTVSCACPPKQVYHAHQATHVYPSIETACFLQTSIQPYACLRRALNDLFNIAIAMAPTQLGHVLPDHFVPSCPCFAPSLRTFHDSSFVCMFLPPSLVCHLYSRTHVARNFALMSPPCIPQFLLEGLPKASLRHKDTIATRFLGLWTTQATNNCWHSLANVIKFRLAVHVARSQTMTTLVISRRW